MKHVLLVNDDGIYAQGIRALAEALSGSFRVTMVAPDRDQSGVGHGLSTRGPLRYTQCSEHTWAVQGTPSDCVHFAQYHQAIDPIDYVVSGINHGANLVEDLLVSGTVAAATTGYFAGIKSVAVSLSEGNDYQSVSEFFLTWLLKGEAWERSSLFSMNFPPRWSALVWTHLGQRDGISGFVTHQDPREHTNIWLTRPKGPSQKTYAGSDFEALDQGKISLTPLRMDCTDYQALHKER